MSRSGAITIPKGEGAMRNPDGTETIAAGTGLLAAQLLARREANQELARQARESSLKSFQSYMTVRDENGQLRQLDPRTEVDRQELLRRGVNVYRALSEEEKNAIPIHVRASLDRIVLDPVAFMDGVAPYQNKFPPDSAMLFNRLYKYSDPVGRAQAVAAGIADYVLHTPKLYAVGAGKHGLALHCTAHEVYSFYMNWYAMLLGGMPVFQEAESDVVLAAVRDAMDASKTKMLTAMHAMKRLKETGAPSHTVTENGVTRTMTVEEEQAVCEAAFSEASNDLNHCPPVNPCDMVTGIKVETLEEAAEILRSGFGVYVSIPAPENESVPAPEDMERPTTTIPVQTLEHLETLRGQEIIGIAREPQLRDCEEWAHAINQSLSTLAVNAGDEEADTTKCVSLNKLARCLFSYFVEGRWPDALVQQLDVGQGLRNKAQETLVTYRGVAFPEGYAVNVDALPLYVRSHLTDHSEAAMFLLHAVLSLSPPPPPSDFDPVAFEQGTGPAPDEKVVAWQAVVATILTIDHDIAKEYLEKYRIKVDALPAEIRAYHIMNPLDKTIPPFAVEWCVARLTSAWRATPEWFTTWWKDVLGMTAPVAIPSWLTDYMLEAVHVLAVNFNYFRQRTYYDMCLEMISENIYALLRDVKTSRAYALLTAKLTDQQFDITIRMLQLMEYTIVAMNARSIPVTKIQDFRSEFLPITRYVCSTDPIEDWKKAGCPGEGDEYLNLYVLALFRRSQKAAEEVFESLLPDTDWMLRIREMDAKFSEDAAVVYKTPETISTRSNMLMHLFYFAHLKEHPGLYDVMFDMCRAKILEILPVTEHNKRRKAFEQSGLGPELEYTISEAADEEMNGTASVEVEIKRLGKRSRDVPPASKKGGKRSAQRRRK